MIILTIFVVEQVLCIFTMDTESDKTRKINLFIKCVVFHISTSKFLKKYFY